MMLYDMKRIGKVFKTARRNKHLTQQALAEKIDVSPKTIGDIEGGKRNPTFDVLFKLIATLDIPADLIFRPEGIEHTPDAEQFIHEFLLADEREQRVAMAVVRDMWTEMKK